MISVSPEFLTAASASYREPCAKCEILFTDSTVQTGNSVTTTSMNDCAGLSSTITDAMLDQTIDTKDITPKKFIINDGTWVNDGSWYPCPATLEDLATNQFGWYTEEMSDSSGDFATPPELRIDFGIARAINQIRIFGMSVAGLSSYDQYPTDFDVEIYDATDTQLNTTSNFTSTSVEKIIDFSDDEIIDATYMILRLNTWSESGTVGKITEFFGVISYTVSGDDIISMDILEEIDDDGQMSINEIDIELQNVDILDQIGGKLLDPYLPDNTDSYLKNSITSNVRLSPSLGFVLPSGTKEYVPVGVAWSTDWDVSESKFEASISARDRMENLRLNSFTLNEVLINYTMYEVVEKILNHAKVNIPLNDLKWDIDSWLSGYTIPYVWFGKNVTYFQALKKISEACLGRCYMNREDVLIVESFIADFISGSPDVTITSDDYNKCDRPVKNSSVKYRVVVPVSELLLSEEGDITTTDDYTFEPGDTSIEITVEWGDDAVVDASVSPDEEDGVTVTLSDITYYPWGITLTANKNTGTEGTFKLKVIGKQLELNKITEAESSSVLYSEKDADKKTERKPQNFMIQTEGLAQLIADTELQTFSDPTNECTVEMFGNPAIEIGDIASIEVYSKLNVFKEFRIVKQKHRFENGLITTITGKKTIDYGS